MLLRKASIVNNTRTTADLVRTRVIVIMMVSNDDSKQEELARSEAPTLSFFDVQQGPGAAHPEWFG